MLNVKESVMGIRHVVPGREAEAKECVVRVLISEADIVVYYGQQLQVSVSDLLVNHAQLFHGMLSGLLAFDLFEQLRLDLPASEGQ